jgi:proline dehydrogenase
MSSVSRVLAAALGVLPPSVIRRAARRYLGGATVAEAVDVARTFAKNGMSVTLAVVGEAATTPAYAERYLHELLDIVATIDATTPDVRIGVKLTGLGLAFDANLASRNLHVIGTAAAEVGSIVEVDMEQACYVDQTLEIVRNTRSTLPNVEAVVQAELYRTASDVQRLIVDRIPARVVKGAYKEGLGCSYSQTEVIRDSFLDVVRRFFSAGVHVGVATHDEYLVWHVLRLAEELGVSADAYEFQMIMGIQEDLRARLVSNGHAVRVTINFGADAHKWSLRRLKENPEIARQMLAAAWRSHATKPDGAREFIETS